MPKPLKPIRRSWYIPPSEEPEKAEGRSRNLAMTVAAAAAILAIITAIALAT